MGRFARVLLEGMARWIEFEDDGAVRLLVRDCGPQSPEYEKPLDGSMLEQLIYLPPCWGSKVLGLAYNYKSLVGQKESYDEPPRFSCVFSHSGRRRDDSVYFHHRHRRRAQAESEE